MFKKRLISSIVLVIVALVTILQGGYLLAAVLLFLSLTAYRELMKACKLSAEGKPDALEITGYVGIVAYYLLMVFSAEKLYLFLAVIMILAAFMFLYVMTFPKYRAEQIMCAFFDVVYAPVMLSCIYLVRSLPYGIYSVWMIFISSWICDTCAYIVGMLIGKHKMAPVLSPKKSIEGAVGGLAGAALLGALYALAINRWGGTTVSPAEFALICFVGGMISMIGDLAASAIKRDHDIKDYGKLIPGHGGILDRFDSVIFTAPVIYFMAMAIM